MAYAPDREKHVEHQILDALEYQIAHPITVDGGDIELGAIEVKDHTTDTRAHVVAGSSAVAGDSALVVADANVVAQLEAGIPVRDGSSALVARVAPGDVLLPTDNALAVHDEELADQLVSELNTLMTDFVGDGSTPLTLTAFKANIDAKIDELLAEIGTGLPVYGVDAVGEDTYADAVVAPARVCHHVLIRVSTHPAIVSFDGGTTDHLYIGAGEVVAMDGLAIPASAHIAGKNAMPGSNYADLRVTVW